jgi:transposase
LSGWRRVERIEQEAKWDGIYVIRTRETAEPLSAADTVRGYKSLAQVERACRSLKGLDLLIRPIRHRTEDTSAGSYFLMRVGLLRGVPSAARVGASAV